MDQFGRIRSVTALTGCSSHLKGIDADGGGPLWHGKSRNGVTLVHVSPIGLSGALVELMGLGKESCIVVRRQGEPFLRRRIYRRLTVVKKWASSWIAPTVVKSGC